MIKMVIDGRKHIEIEACGTMPHIAAEILTGVKTLKDRMDKHEDMGEAFIETLKHGLDFIDTLDEDDDDECEGCEGCEDLEENIGKLVDKAIEDDDFLEFMMDVLPDELKTDFAKRLKDKTSKKK